MKLLYLTWPNAANFRAMRDMAAALVALRDAAEVVADMDGYVPAKALRAAGLDRDDEEDWTWQRMKANARGLCWLLDKAVGEADGDLPGGIDGFIEDLAREEEWRREHRPELFRDDCDLPAIALSTNKEYDHA